MGLQRGFLCGVVNTAVSVATQGQADCIAGVTCDDGGGSLATTTTGGRVVQVGGAVVAGGALLVAGGAALLPAVGAAGAAAAVVPDGVVAAGTLASAVTSGAVIYGNSLDPDTVEEFASMPWDRLMNAFQDPLDGPWSMLGMSQAGDVIFNGCHRVAGMIQQLESGLGDPDSPIPFIGGGGLFTR